MVGSLLLRGMLVGVIAGLLAFGIARVFGEPQIDRAIAFEEQQAPTATEAPEAELVSRSTQAGVGLLTGIVLYGVCIGGLFALVFAYVQGRVSRFGPRGTAALIALAGFVAIILVPQLKLSGQPACCGERRDDPGAYRAVLHYAGHVGRHSSRLNRPRQAPSAATWRVECLDRWRYSVCRGDGVRALRAAADQ